MKKIILNEYPIDTQDLQIKRDSKTGMKKIQTTFQVTHEDYHAVTTLLYENDFNVAVPSQNTEFHATIQNYSTSMDDLYKEGAVGTFYLELIETEEK